MAKGVVIVLTDQDRFNKSKYTQWKKTYQFQILFGVETDSLDLLGIINPSHKALPRRQAGIETYSHIKVLEKKLNQVLPSFMGSQDQIMPNFSAKRIDGESYFDKAKRGEEIDTAMQRITIYDLELLKIKQTNKSNLQTNILNKIKNVKGDFRQKEIIENWQEYFSHKKPSSHIVIAHLKTTVSKRTYIRALVRDIGIKLSIPATTYSITRTQNGPYSVKDCTCLV